jgi:hypothetical protein
MVKVKLPMASWEDVIYMLEDLAGQGYLVKPLLKEICDQVYSQEY